MQYFKGDANELKMYGTISPMFEAQILALNEYWENVYSCQPLGEFLYDSNRVPLVNAIRREIFITSFKEIFESWEFTGTFESYILVFNKIFGVDVVVDFTVPGPGLLEIDITTSGFQLFEAIWREIVDNAYVTDHIVDENGDNILFSTVQGFETQQEAEVMLFTMVPNGIFTTVTLTIEGE